MIHRSYGYAGGVVDELNVTGGGMDPALEEKFREISQLGEQVIRNAPVGIVVYDLNARICGWNPAAEAHTGLKSADVMGRRLGEIFPRLADGVEDALVRGLKGETVVLPPHRYSGPVNGRKGWVASTFTPLRDTSGKVTSVLSIVHDVTNLKTADQAPADRERRLQAILDSVPECIRLMDRDGRVLEINPAGLDLLEAESAEQVIGRNASRIVVPEYQEDFRALTAKAFAGEAGVLEFELIGLKGTRRWAETRSSPLRDSNGTIVAALSVTRDITERKHAEEHYQLLAQRLQEIREEESSRLARQVHDELGQSLAAVRFELIALGRHHEKENDTSAESVAQALKLLEETMQTVRRIALELRPAILDHLGLGPTLEWLGDEFRKRYRCRVSTVGADAPVSLSRDQQVALYRIAQEALTNIGRHAQATGIAIRLFKERDLVVLEIQDNGQGMQPDILQQTNSVGLFSMRERARLAGGTCEIRSNPGKGTLIRVTVHENVPKA
jgi:two-component system sensor histidine kinase UhpB